MLETNSVPGYRHAFLLLSLGLSPDIPLKTTYWHMRDSRLQDFGIIHIQTRHESRSDCAHMVFSDKENPQTHAIFDKR